MEKRFRALRIIGTIYKALGLIAASLTTIVAVASCLTSVLGGAALGNLPNQLGDSSQVTGLLGGALGGILVSLVAIIYGGGISVTLYALGEGVYLLLALEENTRATAGTLRALAPPATQTRT